jgi:cellulose synthase/poly-beta-1,6-N-acetylglucosamine synthase-like glycosyltransferase
LISLPLAIYLLIGPLPWAMLFVGTLLGRARMGRLLNWHGKLPANPPQVTILIPAKDEGIGIRACVESVLAQDYPSFDVIAIDDRSRDETGKILDEIAARDSRLQVMHIDALPPGWLGKCNALHVGAKQASGEWLLFVDSDVTLAADALSSTISLALQRKYDALSILTRLDCRTFLERLMLPLLAGAWAVMYTISWTNEDSRKKTAAANGQFFLIRRSAYEAVGGHEAVKDRIAEDVELMRLLKARDFVTRFFMGAHLASTRMHGDPRQMFNSWARIYSGTSRRKPWRILAASVFVIVAMLSVYPALIWMSFAAAAHLVLMSAYLAMIYRLSGNQMRYALLAPVAGVLMLGIFALSLRKCRSGRIVWRDTEFTS